MTIDGARQASSTTIGAVGAYVIVVATTLPDEVLQLTSCYLAALRGAVAVSQLLLLPGPEHRFAHALLEDPLTGTTHPRRCLLHHAGELHTALAAADRQILVDVGPRALELADTAWRH